jgi:maltose O-acetyltransferase
VAAFIELLHSLGDRIARAYVTRRVLAQLGVAPGSIVLGPDVCRRFHLVSADRLRIGAGTVLNGDCYINAQGGVRIGRYCHIARGLTVLSSNHNFRSTTAIPYDDTDLLKPVEIGEAVWIGANVSIHPGSTIGDGAILALGAVVRGTVEPCAIVAGNPARVVGWRDRETFLELQKREAFS